MGCFWRVFLGGKSPISVPTAAREEARAPPPPRVLWGAFRGFGGILGGGGGFPVARRPRCKMGSEGGILGFALVSAAQNGLGKWDFGSGVLPPCKSRSESGILGQAPAPSAKTGSENGVWGRARFPGAKRAQKAGFWGSHASPAQNELRKRLFGSGTRRQRQMG